jgi:hypothetical protein
MLSIRPSIRRVAFVTFFIVLGALPSTAGVIEVTASGGPATSISASNSVQVEVIGSADVVFDFSWTGAPNPTCTAIDTGQPYACDGGFNALAQFNGPGVFYTENEFDGPYQDINGVYSDDFAFFDHCNNQPGGRACALTLGPGTYVLLASLGDFWEPMTNATAGLVGAESVTATLTINSGTAFVVPEPTTQGLALLGGVFLSALIIRSRLYRT